MLDMAGTTVFDRGGVARVMADVLGHHGAILNPGQFTPLMGLSAVLAVKGALRRASHPGQEDDALIKSIAKELDEALIAHFESEGNEVPGAMRVMDLMKQRGCFVVLDTGFSRHVTDAILTKLKWKGGVIDRTITCDDVNRGKPAPDMIFDTMKRFGVDNPIHVAKVGDTPNDLIMGNTGGCGWVIGVTEGTHAREALIPYPHTHLVSNVNDLPELLLS
jgi:phosphonatase-like hydrolase